MYIFNPAKFLQEIFKVVLLGEASQLRSVVQAHIDQAFYARFFESSKEAGGGALRETDRVDLHSSSFSHSGNSAGCKRGSSNGCLRESSTSLTRLPSPRIC